MKYSAEVIPDQPGTQRSSKADNFIRRKIQCGRWRLTFKSHFTHFS